MSDLPEVTPVPTAGAPDPDQPETGSQPQAGTEVVRLMISVSQLTAHPGNVREDLELTPEFCASIAGAGVRVPLLVTATSDGAYRVIEGHRRLAAAAKAGLEMVPCDLDPGRAEDEAGQYLDMVLANSDAYRRNFVPAEEAAALFAAHEVGAVPLMNGFSPSDWDAFRAGYIRERGADGERVIDYIQSRDLTGWIQAPRRNDLDKAARLLSEQLETDADLPTSMRPNMLLTLGMLLSRAGRHAEALAAHQAAVAAAGDDGPSLVTAIFNQARALLRADDAPAAVTLLEQVVAREREDPTAPGLLEAAIQTLEKARTLAG